MSPKGAPKINDHLGLGLGLGLGAGARGSGWTPVCVYIVREIYIYILIQQYRGRQGLAHSPQPEPTARANSPSRLYSPPLLAALFGSLLSANATIARNPYPIRHFSRQNVVYCSFSKKERVFPDWSSLFGPFLGYFQKRDAICVDFEERNTASVDVWVIFGSFSKNFRITHCSLIFSGASAYYRGVQY